MAPSITHLLNRNLEHYVRISGPDGYGGTETTMTPVGPVSCRVSQPSAAEKNEADAWQGELSHVIYMDPEVLVERGDELRDEAAGEKFRVLAILYPSVDIYRKAMCELQQYESELPETNS